MVDELRGAEDSSIHSWASSSSEEMRGITQSLSMECDAVLRQKPSTKYDSSMFWLQQASAHTACQFSAVTCRGSFLSL